ncbi:hypothetical protein FA592_13435 [Sulfurospirillum diekertiae]|uniref:Uncharacterized protein n=1 Tax=Sulfurospirillum diekertiae TaxID=1854492 RepID=A0A6G9VW66_9BACT|nr:helix-turn-helix domain-containing protein [Sulfurospirillum diekertiae]QIR77182.1 hypothetical protein FA584_13640 [Sulfurospirillum diekertiae]QIR79796.1 hypothetical protein FA592_13435 [Sulfurospirillum diekertiae]
MSYFELLYAKYNKMILTKDEIALELGISIKTLERRLFDNEPIKFFKTSQKLQFPLKAFAEYLEAVDELCA